MGIFEFEGLIKTLRQSQNTFAEMLEHDADYNELKELPSRESASYPHDIIRGANLRAKLERKYSSPAVQEAKLKLDEALLQFKNALNLMDQPNVSGDRSAEKLNVETRKNTLSDKTICQLAADNAITLAWKSSSQLCQNEPEGISTDAPSVEDTRRINSSESNLDEFENIIQIPKEHLNTTVDISNENEDALDEKYLPIPMAKNGVVGVIAYSFMALIAVFTIGAVLPESAEASKYLFR